MSFRQGKNATDKPVPGDYDGDGNADLAIYRANIGAWFIYPSSTGPSGIYGVGFGGDESDLPVMTNPGFVYVGLRGFGFNDFPEKGMRFPRFIQTASLPSK